MSVKIMSQVWELDLPAEQQQIMLALADHAHDDGSKCHPGIAYLAWKTGKGESSVQRILRQLRDDGLIVAAAYFKGGRGHATEYRICLGKGLKKPPFVRDEDLNHLTDEALYEENGLADEGVSSIERVSPVEERVSPTTERVSPVRGKGLTGETPTIINHQRTIKESGTGAHAPRAPNPGKVGRPISAEEIERLVVEFADRLRGADTVREMIEEAVDFHVANRKQSGQYLFTRGWLRRDAQSLEKTNGTTGRNGTQGAGGQGRRGVQRAGSPAASAGRSGGGGHSPELRDLLNASGIKARPASPN